MSDRDEDDDDDEEEEDLEEDSDQDTVASSPTGLLPASSCIYSPKKANK